MSTLATGAQLDGLTHINVLVAAKDFLPHPDAGNKNRENPDHSNLTTPYAQNGSYEWKVNLPRGGRWYLHALMATPDARPCDLLINGKRQPEKILGGSTGGSRSNHLQWFRFGPYDFNPGENVFRIEWAGVWAPHLKTFLFSTDEALLRVSAKEFDGAPGGGVSNNEPNAPNSIYSWSKESFAAWKVFAPTEGKYFLRVYAGMDHDKAYTLKINGASQGEIVIPNAGGMHGEDFLRWFEFGPYHLKPGENKFQLEFTNYSALIREFIWSRDPADVPPPVMRKSVLTGDVVRVPSKSYQNASASMSGEDAEYGGLTVSRSSSLAVWLEWKVHLPRAGKWYLHANMAAGSSRPGTLTLNGVKQGLQVCGNTTTGWHARDTKWFVYGPFDCKAGDNVFRIDFANMMPSLKEFAFSESMKDVAEVTVWAADFVPARSLVDGTDQKYSNLVYTSRHKPSFIEWDVKIPKAGKWLLHALATAEESRPGTLSINGAAQSGQILGETTGGWHSDKLKWFSYGPYEFQEGDNKVRVDFANYHPHLRELGFTLEEAGGKPLSAAERAALEKLIGDQKARIDALEEALRKNGDCCTKISGLETRIGALEEVFKTTVEGQQKAINDLTEAVTKLKQALDAATKPAEPPKPEVKPDPQDLTKIEGIGDGIAKLLAGAGITTYQQLADTTVERLKEIIAAGGRPFATAKPTTWPRQAKLAAEGKWAELKAWQDILVRGEEP